MVGPPLRTVLRVLVGSHAYGMATPQSDHDYLEVYLEPTDHLLGLDEPPDGWCAKEGTSDAQYWELRKYCRLALAGNPGALELLFAPHWLVKVRSLEGWMLTSPKTVWFVTGGAGAHGLRDAFLSKQAHARYRGFVYSQSSRMVKDGRSSHGHAIPEGQAYDLKAAAHCLRLLVQGTELLGTGTLTVDVSGHELHPVIRDVRAGKVGLASLLSRIDEWLGRLQAAHERSPLPDEPDRAAVEAWLIRTRLQETGR
jgi:predicted nucleotidyltransferase